MSELEQQIAACLHRDAITLVRRWRARLASVHGQTTDPPTEAVDAGTTTYPMLVEGIAAALIGDARGTVKLARAGWQLGGSRYREGTELLEALREVQLLDAIVMYAAERQAEALGGAVADGLRVARGLQRGTSFLLRAVTKGFTYTWLIAQRERASSLRHDIRNPLGTIRNAIAFLEDETIPSHLRDIQRFRSMIVRNAAHADSLVSRHLGDGVVMDDALVGRPVSIHDVALAVKRGLREEAKEAGVEIVVGDGLPVVSVDASAVELTLIAAVAGALEGGASRRLSIDADATHERSVRIRIGMDAGRRAEGAGLVLAQELTTWMGGALLVEDNIILELPLSPRQSRRDLAGPSQR